MFDMTLNTVGWWKQFKDLCHAFKGLGHDTARITQLHKWQVGRRLALVVQ